MSLRDMIREGIRFEYKVLSDLEEEIKDFNKEKPWEHNWFKTPIRNNRSNLFFKYYGFDWSDRDYFQKNINLMRRFKKYLPGNIYVFPLFHKGGCSIQCSKIIEDNWDNEITTMDGQTTEEIIEFCIKKQQTIEANCSASKYMKEQIEKEYPMMIYRDTKKHRYYVLKRQGWRCNFCNCVLKFNKNSDWDGEVAHIDHIHPFSDRLNYPNGAEMINESSNLQGLCSGCNLGKGKKKI